ncbi:MAG: hypothetical protein J1E63_10165, partial [Muribaculaceae bacterium]|nr:hypothetical protein [Muribaculaceae bacterium]
SVLPTLDWAAEIAKREDVAVVSGFHSKMEREVLDYLLRGRCGIICVLARSIYRKVPHKFIDAFNQNRVLFISEEKNRQTTMTGKATAQKRNRHVASMSDELVFSSLSPDSSLYQIFQSSEKPTTTI